MMDRYFELDTHGQVINELHRLDDGFAIIATLVGQTTELNAGECQQLGKLIEHLQHHHNIVIHQLERLQQAS